MERASEKAMSKLTAAGECACANVTVHIALRPLLGHVK
jgi:hypothetical protein